MTYLKNLWVKINKSFFIAPIFMALTTSLAYAGGDTAEQYQKAGPDREAGEPPDPADTSRHPCKETYHPIGFLLYLGAYENR